MLLSRFKVYKVYKKKAFSQYARLLCHAKSMAWTNRVFFPGFIMWATVLWVFGCLASLDGPLVTNSLFSQTCLSHLLLGVAWADASFSRGEGGDVKHTFMAHTCNPCLSWYHDSSWQTLSFSFWSLPSSPWILHSGVQLTRLNCLLWLSIRLFLLAQVLPFIIHSSPLTYHFS